MANTILEFFSELGGSQVILITFLVAMIPVIELKGAIPFGASSQFWGGSALSVWSSFGIAYLGCSVISVLLILLYKKLLQLLMKIELTRKLADKIRNNINGHKEDIDTQINKSKSKHTRLVKALAMGAFVAVPLPLTGVWTGACLTTVLNMPVLDSILSVLLGNIVCGLIITLVSKQFEAYTHIILLVILILALVLFIGKIVVSKFKHKHTLATADTSVADSAALESISEEN
jgi:uncharacterized membrane protein